MPGPGPNMIHDETWVRDWVTGTWSIDGTPTMLAPTVPVAHGVPTAEPIEMTSEGIQKVTVQYSGPANEMPSELGIVLTSTAQSSFGSNYAGSASASNGLGDEELYVPPLSDYSILGMAGFRSYGRHFRVVKLNSAGYGELEFSSSASASQSGFGAKVWANAQSAAAVFDLRNIGLTGPYRPYFKAGPPLLGSVNHTHTYGNGYQVTKIFDIIYNQPVALEMASNSLYSSYLRGPIGITRSVSSESLYYAHGGLQKHVSDPGYTGTSSFPYQHQYNSHGSYEWTFSLPHWFLSPQQGMLTNDYDATVSSGFYLEHPHQCNDWQGNYTGEHLNDCDKTVVVKFAVQWADGVKGEVQYELDTKDLAESIFKTDYEKFGEESSVPLRPVHVMEPVGNNYDSWIDGPIERHNFYAPGTPVIVQWQLENKPLIDWFINTLGSAPKVGPYLAAAANNISFAARKEFEEDIQLVSRLGAKRLDVQSNVVGYSWQQFLANQNGWEWQMWAEPCEFIAFESFQNYDANGFVSSSSVPILGSTNDKLADHWLKVRFSVSEGE